MAIRAGRPGKQAFAVSDGKVNTATGDKRGRDVSIEIAALPVALAFGAHLRPGRRFRQAPTREPASACRGETAGHPLGLDLTQNLADGGASSASPSATTSGPAQGKLRHVPAVGKPQRLPPGLILRWNACVLRGEQHMRLEAERPEPIQRPLGRCLLGKLGGQVVVGAKQKHRQLVVGETQARPGKAVRRPP